MLATAGQQVERRSLWDRALAVPVLAILLIVTLTTALIWLTARDQRAEARLKLTSDALWVEQYLRFQLQSYEGELRGFANDIGTAITDPATIMTRARHLANLHPEVLAITWFDPEGAVRIGAPPTGAHTTVFDEALAHQALARGVTVYSPLRRGNGDGWWMWWPRCLAGKPRKAACG